MELRNYYIIFLGKFYHVDNNTTYLVKDKYYPQSKPTNPLRISLFLNELLEIRQ